jgi:hypothetical protein
MLRIRENARRALVMAALPLLLSGPARSAAAPARAPAPAPAPLRAPAPVAAPPITALRANEAAQVAALIPDGAVTAEVLTPDYSQKMQEISRRLINAAQADPAWFQNWIARHPGGQLPWHPNLGVTKPEYELYLREGREAKFAVRTRVRLNFERAGRSRRWVLHGWGLLTPLEGLTIDLDQGHALSPRWGELPFAGVAEPTDPGVQLPWKWYGVWKASHVVGDPRRQGQAASSSLHIGPLGDGKMVGLYWTSRRLNRGRQLADEFLLLRFPARGR